MTCEQSEQSEQRPRLVTAYPGIRPRLRKVVAYIRIDMSQECVHMLAGYHTHANMSRPVGTPYSVAYAQLLLTESIAL